MMVGNADSICCQYPGENRRHGKEKRRGGNMLYTLKGIQHIFPPAGNERASSKSNASIPRIRTTDYQKDAKRF